MQAEYLGPPETGIDPALIYPYESPANPAETSQSAGDGADTIYYLGPPDAASSPMQPALTPTGAEIDGVQGGAGVKVYDATTGNVSIVPAMTTTGSNSGPAPRRYTRRAPRATQPAPTPATPATTPDAAAQTNSGISGIFSSIPTWVLLAGAGVIIYWLFFSGKK